MQKLSSEYGASKLRAVKTRDFTTLLKSRVLRTVFAWRKTDEKEFNQINR
jgi:hypothetical protein